MKRVLFLCTGNSARSILAEVLLNDLAEGSFAAFSAGSQPTGQVNPGALRKLAREGHRVDGLTSKSWDQFGDHNASDVDIVITVCDNAAGESCPIRNGAPVSVHWGIPDPAVDGDFDSAYRRLRRRIEAMLALPLKEMSKVEIANALEQVHQRAN